MYHYVRPSAAGLPYFPFLSLADFERQLDDFAESYGFVGREDFVRWAEGGPAPEGVLLTFDDGLRDHAEFVLPALRARGLFGLFYVSSGPAMTGRVYLVGAENVLASTDCGFAQGPYLQRVHPTIQWAKLEALAEGAAIASRALATASR